MDIGGGKALFQIGLGGKPGKTDVRVFRGDGGFELIDAVASNGKTKGNGFASKFAGKRQDVLKAVGPAKGSAVKKTKFGGAKEFRTNFWIACGERIGFYQGPRGQFHLLSLRGMLGKTVRHTGAKVGQKVLISKDGGCQRFESAAWQRFFPNNSFGKKGVRIQVETPMDQLGGSEGRFPSQGRRDRKNGVSSGDHDIGWVLFPNCPGAPRSTHPKRIGDSAVSAVLGKIWSPSAEVFNLVESFRKRVGCPICAAGPIGAKNPDLPSPFLKSMGQIRKMPGTDDIVRREEMVVDINGWQGTV